MAPRQRSPADGSHLRALLLAGGVVRAALLAWGAWQDAHMAVKFTDIDYQVRPASSPAPVLPPVPNPPGIA